MVATLPRERSTTKLQAIGQTEEISHWLGLADVFLSTSDQEGFGLSIAEAMLAGVPVVSSPFGLAENPAIADQVHSEDVAEWVSAILNAGSKVETAKAYVEKNHSPDVIAKKWTNFLDRIL
jgi:glycosyltransferase involved in cell wall biosynthesis